MKYRRATADDVTGVATLHADSWRRNYRGAYLDSFLDSDVLADRLTVWTERLTQPRQEYTIVADLDGTVVGFSHTILAADATWGALLDNLHVAHDQKRQGIGTRLMAETARLLLQADASAALHLWVLEQNTSAQAFYTDQGGSCVGRKTAGPFPGGGHAPALRYAWPDPQRLLDGADRASPG